MYINLHKSLVRPVIEYGNVIWGPHYILDRHSIEQMQRRAARIITILYDTPYCDCLNVLKLPTLQYRRLQGDMILLYRIFHINIEYVLKIILLDHLHQLEDTVTYEIFKPQATTRVRSNFLQ